MHDVGIVDGSRHALLQRQPDSRGAAGRGASTSCSPWISSRASRPRSPTSVAGRPASTCGIGDEMLVGIYSSGVSVEPWSVDLAGNVGFVDFEQVGLQARLLRRSCGAIGPDHLCRRIEAVVGDADDAGRRQQLVLGSTRTPGPNREFTLPNGPTQVERHRRSWRLSRAQRRSPRTTWRPRRCATTGRDADAASRRGGRGHRRVERATAVGDPEPSRRRRHG